MKTTTKILIFTFLFIGLFAFFKSTNAQNPFDVEFPIAELGSCSSFDDCKNYCDIPDNQPDCINWAAKNGYMTEAQAQKAKILIEKTGPGGCKGEECRTYCEDSFHIEECFAFAKDNNLILPDELERVKKFMEAIEEGGPGDCQDPMSCQTFCQDPSHQEECFEFAEEKGLVSDEEREQFEIGKKLNEKLQESGGPGGCKTEQECRSYCSNPENVEECIAFASAHGGVSAEKARQMLKQFTELQAQFQAQGGLPGPEDFERFQQERLQDFEKFRQLERTFRSSEGAFEGEFVGPGGCNSPDECIKYCTEHKEHCFSFGPPGQPYAVPPEGGIPPGHDFLQILPGILKSGEEFPENFDQLSPEKRAEIYMQKFESSQTFQPSGDTDPAKKCIEYYGGAWDGSNCKLPLAPTSGENSQPQYKIDPATECAKYNGTWNGDSCIFPAPPTSFFDKLNYLTASFIDSVLRMFFKY